MEDLDSQASQRFLSYHGVYTLYPQLHLLTLCLHLESPVSQGPTSSGSTGKLAMQIQAQWFGNSPSLQALVYSMVCFPILAHDGPTSNSYPSLPALFEQGAWSLSMVAG